MEKTTPREKQLGRRHLATVLLAEPSFEKSASGRLRIPHFVSGGGVLYPNTATYGAGGLFSSNAGELPSLKPQLIISSCNAASELA